MNYLFDKTDFQAMLNQWEETLVFPIPIIDFCLEYERTDQARVFYWMQQMHLVHNRHIFPGLGFSPFHPETKYTQWEWLFYTTVSYYLNPKTPYRYEDPIHEWKYKPFRNDIKSPFPIEILHKSSRSMLRFSESKFRFSHFRQATGSSKIIQSFQGSFISCIEFFVHAINIDLMYKTFPVPQLSPTFP